MEHTHDENRPEAGLPLGFGGLSAVAGDHIVHFYQTREDRLAIQLPFLVEGLRRNDKCVVLLATEDREELESALSREGVDVTEATESEQLVLTDGRSTVDDLRGLLSASVASVPERHDSLRWCGDMTWTFSKIPTTEVLLEWECACNVVGPARVVFMCHYDLTRFSGELVIDALRAHPLAVIGRAVHQSPYYEGPEAVLQAYRDRHAGEPSASA